MKIIIKNGGKTFKIPIPYKLITSRNLRKFMEKQNEAIGSDYFRQEATSQNSQSQKTKEGFYFTWKPEKASCDGSQGDFDLSDLTDDQLKDMVKRLKRMRKDYPGLPMVEVISANGDGVTIMP